MAAQYYILPDNVKLEEVQLVNAQDVQFGTQQFVLAPDQNLGNMQIVYQSTEEPQNNAPSMISPQNFTQRRWILTEEGTLQPQVKFSIISYLVQTTFVKLLWLSEMKTKLLYRRPRLIYFYFSVTL